MSLQILFVSSQTEFQQRVHSSRMRTARNSSRLFGGGGGSASVHAGINLPPGPGPGNPSPTRGQNDRQV